MEGPGVRILTSTNAITYEEGKRVILGKPWPDYLKSADRVLPEYASLTNKFTDNGVMIGPQRWEVWQADDSRTGPARRARVDIMLVVDGDIIDLNRIKLPPDTPIVDNRRLDGSPSADAPDSPNKI